MSTCKYYISVDCGIDGSIIFFSLTCSLAERVYAVIWCGICITCASITFPSRNVCEVVAVSPCLQSVFFLQATLLGGGGVCKCASTYAFSASLHLSNRIVYPLSHPQRQLSQLTDSLLALPSLQIIVDNYALFCNWKKSCVYFENSKFLDTNSCIHV